MLMSEIKEDWIQQWKSFVLPALASGGVDPKGKKQVKFDPLPSSETDYSSDESETSMTQEISEKTKRLCIVEKRKRAVDAPIGDSPPMETPPNRAAARGGITSRMTRARTKGALTPILAKRRSAIKTPLSKLTKNRKTTPPSGKLTPASRALSRLRHRDSIMRELKECNAEELQRFCKDEGIPYVGKIDAIFDLAEHRATMQFPSFVPAPK
ncbi:hypothetical protein CBR_g27986 [Chara braunii]|uniref:Uncharacterized protein n=1 Tax=Chara braunii TaxID=69332 RepID=A0A388L949_CHABU|nr:hypothetical protein CBR_g27986 [Chara braunii]|eukprot:GBG78762.1 hypothetical protein CBR_g27986 [Chara braunii]